MYRPLGGEEKAGFGAQPRDFDTILPCPGDISNNIGHVGASNFKMLLRNPNPQLYLAVPGLDAPRLGGGLHFEKFPGYSFICVLEDRARFARASSSALRASFLSKFVVAAFYDA